MLDSRRYSYFEYSSIAFFFISILYFSSAFYSKYHSNNSIVIDSTLKNFDVYQNILDKYDAKVVDFKIVNGYVEAFIEKNGFFFDEFNVNEPYLAEELDENYLITFKVVKKVHEAKIEQKFVIQPNSGRIDSFCFISNDHWFLSINGISFDQNNLKKNDIEIVSVEDGRVVLTIAGLQKVFEF